MKQFLLRNLVSVSIITTVVMTVAGLLFVVAASPKNAPPNRADVGIDQKLGEKLPLDARFRDESGRDVQLGEYFHSRPVVMALIFYRCAGSCSEILNDATKTFNDMKNLTAGTDYDFLAISIHPKETPELARAKKSTYLDMYRRPGAERGYHFLTGTEQNIRKVTNAIGFKYTYNAQKDLITHPAGLYVLTPNGEISRYFYGVGYTSKLVDRAIVDARASKIGARAEPKFFGCFQVDPVTRQMTVNVINLLKVVGIATVLIYLLFVVVSLRNSKMPKLPEPEVGGSLTS